MIAFGCCDPHGGGVRALSDITTEDDQRTTCSPQVSPAGGAISHSFHFHYVSPAKPGDLGGTYLAYISIEELRNAGADLQQERLRRPLLRFRGCSGVRVRVHAALCGWSQFT